MLCHQPLTENAEKLITNYWAFIKSVAQENARKAQEALNKEKQVLEKLNFDLFPDNNTLSVWLADKYPNQLNAIRKTLSEQKTLAENVISDIQNKAANTRAEISIIVAEYTVIDDAIDSSINGLQNDVQSRELEKLLKTKIYLEHKEKFNSHLSKFETYVNNQIWIKKANNADFAKRKITETENLYQTSILINDILMRLIRNVSGSMASLELKLIIQARLINHIDN